MLYFFSLCFCLVISDLPSDSPVHSSDVRSVDESIKGILSDVVLVCLFVCFLHLASLLSFSVCVCWLPSPLRPFIIVFLLRSLHDSYDISESDSVD